MGVVFLGQATWLWKQKGFDKKLSTFGCNIMLKIHSFGNVEPTDM